jgi:thiamine kinase-like enzyme
MDQLQMNPSLSDRIRALPCWQGAIAIEPLKGGLSNESYKVTDPAGTHVVRIGADYPFHHVFREREVMVARAAHAAGFGPEVRYSEPGLMVTQFLGAKTFSAADVRSQADRVADIVRRFHQTMPRHVSGPAFMFWPFHVVRDYARLLVSGKSRMAARIPEWMAISERLEAAQVPLPIVFGHNDLLPANFLDDGERLWLIDFEYAGYSTAMFDLAGIASNAEMDAQTAERLIAIYFGHAPEPEIIRAHAAMQCASLLRETMWSLVSELHLNAPGADYVQYTKENLERFDAAMERFQMQYGRLEQ